MKKAWHRVALAFLLLIWASGGLASQDRTAISIDDLTSRVQIPRFSISPAGTHAAYLTLQALTHENRYAVVLNLIPITGGAPLVLARYKLTTPETVDSNTDSVLASVGQFGWSPDGKELVYTVHEGSRMELRSHFVAAGTERTLVTGAQRIEIGNAGSTLTFTVSNADTTKDTRHPVDDILQIKDGYALLGISSSDPKAEGKFVVQHWSYRWGAPPAAMVRQDAPAYLHLPVEFSGLPWPFNEEDTLHSNGPEFVSPDETVAAFLETGQEAGPGDFRIRTLRILLKSKSPKDAPPRILVDAERPRVLGQRILGWSPDSRVLYYLTLTPRVSMVNAVDRDGKITNIFTEECALSSPQGGTIVGKDMKTVVQVRSKNLIPDELVAIDLKSGALSVLAHPNTLFDGKSKPSIRFLEDTSDPAADAFARLYLPAGSATGRGYPLVITQYYSWPGFELTSSEDAPVPTLVAHGIAVLHVHLSGFNVSSTGGHFERAVARKARPVVALETWIAKLAKEGVIDPTRVGLVGLSYGSDVAMYAYWKSQSFRAISSSTSGAEATGMFLAGVRQAKVLRDLIGQLGPDDSRWTQVSPGRNARADLPPLLWQTGDAEAMSNVETWTRLREAGAQVEWLHYPNEGHVRTQPAHIWWVFEHNVDWFRFWLKDEEDPDPYKADQYARWREMRDKLATPKTAQPKR